MGTKIRLERNPALHVYRFLCIKGVAPGMEELSSTWLEDNIIWWPRAIRYIVVSKNFYYHYLSIYDVEKLGILPLNHFIDLSRKDDSLVPRWYSRAYRFDSFKPFRAWLWAIFLPHVKVIDFFVGIGTDKEYIKLCGDIIREYPAISFNVRIHGDDSHACQIVSVLKSKIITVKTRFAHMMNYLEGASLKKLIVPEDKYIRPFFDLNVESAFITLSVFTQGGWPQNPYVKTLYLSYHQMEPPYSYRAEFTEIRRCFPNLECIVLRAFQHCILYTSSSELLEYVRSAVRNHMHLIGQAKNVCNVIMSLHFHSDKKLVDIWEAKLHIALQKQKVQKVSENVYKARHSTITVRVIREPYYKFFYSIEL